MEYRKIFVSKDELLDIHHRGYQGRYMTPRLTDLQVLEVFELGQPPTIYLNQDNTDTEHTYILAHCMGHVEFVKLNDLLKNLRKPRMTHDMLVPFMEYTDFDLFIYTMRQLGQTIQNLNTRFVAPIDYLLETEWFESWQVRLMKLVKEEASYFDAIKRTKLMNEGWAVFSQNKYLEDSDMKIGQKLELAQLEARLHYKPNKGLNEYSLGRAIWNEVPHSEQRKVMQNFEDTQFINHYYTEQVHDKEKISFVLNQAIISDYTEVKEQLFQYFRHQTLKMYVDQEVTNQTGQLTLKYQCNPYQINVYQLKKIKKILEHFLKSTIYIKPLSITKAL